MRCTAPPTRAARCCMSRIRRWACASARGSTVRAPRLACFKQTKSFFFIVYKRFAAYKQQSNIQAFCFSKNKRLLAVNCLAPFAHRRRGVFCFFPPAGRGGCIVASTQILIVDVLNGPSGHACTLKRQALHS